MKEEILKCFILEVIFIGLIGFACALLSRLIFETRALKFRTRGKLIVKLVPILTSIIATTIGNVLCFTLFRAETVAIEIVGCLFFSLLTSFGLYYFTAFAFVKLKVIFSARTRINRALSKDTIKLLRNKIYSLTKQINVCKNDLIIIANKTYALNRLKDIIKYDNSDYITGKIYEIDCYLKSLKIDEKDVKEDIVNKSKDLEDYTRMLYIQKPKFAFSKKAS